jgi:hypothetical protein
MKRMMPLPYDHELRLCTSSCFRTSAVGQLFFGSTFRVLRMSCVYACRMSEFYSLSSLTRIAATPSNSESYKEDPFRNEIMNTAAADHLASKILFTFYLRYVKKDSSHKDVVGNA